jgi:diacylglycerol kinase (ATP)
MTRPSTVRLPTDEDAQALSDVPNPGADSAATPMAATSGAAAQPACDTGAPARTAMTPRSSSPQSSAQPAAPSATEAAQAGAQLPAARPAAVATPMRALARAQNDLPQPPLSHHDAAEPADPHEPHEPLSPDDPLAPPPFNPYKGNRGLTRAWHAFKNSIAGFRVAIREESAFRQELTLAAILVPIGIVVPVEPVARVLLLGSVMLVLIVELINSSIENAIDRIGLERNELSRRAKDLGSAAVTVALAVCVMTWGLILVPLFGPPLLHWLGSL